MGKKFLHTIGAFAIGSIAALPIMAQAGEIRANLIVGGKGDVKISLQGEAILLEKLESEESRSSWRFKFSDSASIGKIIFNFNDVPDGFFIPGIVANILFSDEGKSYDYFPYVAKSVIWTESVSQIITDATSMNIFSKDSDPGRAKNLFQIQSRARAAYKYMRDNGTIESPIKPNHLKIAYILVFTTNELIKLRKMEPDDFSYDAVNWLTSVTKDPANKSVLEKSALSSSDIDDARRIMNSYQNNLYVSALDEIIKASGGANAKAPLSVCTRARQLWESLRSMSEEVYASTTSQGGVDIRLSTFVGNCLVVKTIVDADFAPKVYDKLQELIPKHKGPEQTNAETTFQNLKKFGIV